MEVWGYYSDFEYRTNVNEDFNEVEAGTAQIILIQMDSETVKSIAGTNESDYFSLYVYNQDFIYYNF